jgi:hypothetical protein
MPREKTPAQLDRDVEKALKTPVVVVKRADEVIRAAQLDMQGFASDEGWSDV